MKSALLLLSGTAFAALFFLSGTYAASSILASDEIHEFEHIGNPLWTSEPTYLNRGNLTLSEAKVKFAGSSYETAAIVAPEPGREEPQKPQDDVVNLAHLDWCMSRYRSYRVDDDTYQPYGGPRRKCESPYGQSEMVEAVDMMETSSVGTAAAAGELQEEASFDGAEWCRRQYRSYRASDNTYQPFSGPRRSCMVQSY
ncbi:BA14K family protein [Pararhizobium arenae]|uniref:BA14K family protein n=1 Tax=Pararhizobium arenae TaxID=1856850 RepID=UPI00094B271D|nr:BA14K family protein [Pararhizobium arenae]